MRRPSNVGLVLIGLTLWALASCRTEPTQRAGASARASDSSTCSRERLGQLRDWLAQAPREHVERSRAFYAAPITSLTGAAVAWNASVLRVMHKDIDLSVDGRAVGMPAHERPPSDGGYRRAIDALTARAKALRNEGDVSDSVVVEVLANEDTSYARHLSELRDVVRMVEEEQGLRLVLGFVIQKPERLPQFHPHYPMPVPMSDWVWEWLERIWRSQAPDGDTSAALSEVAPECPAAVQAAMILIRDGRTKRHPEHEEALIAALETCVCDRIKWNDFVGLLLGSVGFRNPYSLLRLATTPNTPWKLTVPADAPLKDIVARWPVGAATEPVWLEVSPPTAP